MIRLKGLLNSMEADEMANMTLEAKLGDIIRSEKFAYGCYETEFNNEGYLQMVKGIIDVDGSTREQIASYIDPESKVRHPSYKSIDIAAYDPSRGNALFVVEEARMEGGGTAMFNDYYPDGWHVKARRLGPNENYDSDGELIRFYQSGCFTTNIGDVELVEKMRMAFLK